MGVYNGTGMAIRFSDILSVLSFELAIDPNLYKTEGRTARKSVI
ncbi:MAG: hypothetical protein WDM78_02210 [Puia sp.]